MSAYASISTGFAGDLLTKRMIRRLGHEAGWSLVCLILWMAENRPDGDLSDMTAAEVEGAARWRGEQGALFLALGSQTSVAAGLWRAPPTATIKRICSKTWRRIRLAVFDRDGWRCTYCGDADSPLECDHIVPIARGGTHDKSNLTTACKRCNGSKWAKLVSEWRRSA